MKFKRKITKNNSVIIPKDILDSYGFKAGDDAEIVVNGDNVDIKLRKKRVEE